MRIEVHQRIRFEKAVRDILENELFQNTRKYIHHKDITGLDHSVHVAADAVLVAENQSFDTRFNGS